MTIEEKLIAGYTLYLSHDANGEKGGYLRATSQGMEPTSLNGDEFLLLKEFPMTMSAMENGQMLQMYRGDLCHMFTIMMGNESFEGPYGEGNCLENITVVYDSSPILALMKLENVIENNKEDAKAYKKAYRLYGSDKYQFYPKKFLGEEE